MNFSEALLAHVRWSLRFKDAIGLKQALDVATISAADRCEFGNWLQGEAKAKYGTLPAYAECVAKHAHLHRVAGRVARQINAGDRKQAEALLHEGSAYVEASIELGIALTKLDAELANDS